MSRLPLRVRLVGGFALAMLLLLSAAGALVFWRVEVALDRTLSGELTSQVATVQDSLREHPGRAEGAVADLPAGILAQLVTSDGTVLASTPVAVGRTLLAPAAAATAVRTATTLDPGNYLRGGRGRVRARTVPLPDGQSAIVTAVSLRQRDETLRELLAQLVLANLVALGMASLVGERLARAALRPVEAYRQRAAQIAGGAAGVRLDVPASPDDEVTRLGHTLNQMLASLEESAHAQRQFLADASHELRSPLTLLSSEVELALRRPRSAQEYEATLLAVASDTARLVALADQLLELEHATRPTGAGQTTSDLVAAARDALARTPLAGRERVLSVPEGRLEVALTELELDQVLRNLLDNALVHGTGGVTVTVSTTPDRVLLTVTDEGAGLATDFVPHAIERFRRADPARTAGGSGLGLALVHQLVTRREGELRMCTAGGHHRFPPLREDAPCDHPPTGTSVTVVLPRT